MSTGLRQPYHPSGAPNPAPSRHHGLTLATAAAAVMILLALVGIGLTIANSQSAEFYWIILVPVYGLLCVVTAWYRHGTHRIMVIRQVLHWAGIAAAIGLDFAYIRHTGEQTSAATGLTALLLLALGCYLAGIHMEWVFALVGVLLTGTLVAVATGDQYLPLFLGAGGVFLLIMIVARWFLHRRAKSTTPKPA